MWPESRAADDPGNLAPRAGASMVEDKMLAVALVSLAGLLVGGMLGSSKSRVKRASISCWRRTWRCRRVFLVICVRGD